MPSDVLIIGKQASLHCTNAQSNETFRNDLNDTAYRSVRPQELAKLNRYSGPSEARYWFLSIDIFSAPVPPEVRREPDGG